MDKLLERVLSAALALAALTFVGILVRREFFAPPVAEATPGRTSRFESTWSTVVSTAGRQINASTGPAVLIEFSDIQCPFCREYHKTIQSVLKSRPGKVRYVYVHLPIPGHDQARPGGIAVECARQVGRAMEMLDAIFAKPDSLGDKSWVSYGSDAGISDTTAFGKCLKDPTNEQIIDAGSAEARRIGVGGTPGILLNGWKYGRPPTESELLTAIDALLAGKQPYPEFPKSALKAP